jgi:hypothetical protein
MREDIMNEIISNKIDTEEKINRVSIYLDDETNCQYTPLFFEKFDGSLFNKVNFTDRQSNHSNTIAVCLTAYNENIESYEISLKSLFKSAQYYIEQDKEILQKDLIICIIVDGMDTMSPLFSKYAQNIGIYDPNLLDNNAEYHLFESSIPHHIIDTKTLDNSDALHNLTCQKIVLFIKNKNYGKLHSH